jgi:hypothetical protein
LRRFSSAKNLFISAPGVYDADSPINCQIVDLQALIGANPAIKTSASPKLRKPGSAVTDQMKLGEASNTPSVQKRRAVERGRNISNLTVSLILSFVVTAAAQSERINQEGRILGAAPLITTSTVFSPLPLRFR